MALSWKVVKTGSLQIYTANVAVDCPQYKGDATLAVRVNGTLISTKTIICGSEAFGDAAAAPAGLSDTGWSVSIAGSGTVPYDLSQLKIAL